MRYLHRIVHSSLLAPSLLTCLVCVLLVGNASSAPPDNFPNGVASGDVTQDTAVLWTRTVADNPVQVQVSTSPRFNKSKIVFKQTINPSSDDDLTVKALATGLAPDTTYFFRWRKRSGGKTSEVGSFRTAPDSSTSADVRFAYSADSDGFFGSNYEVLDGVRAEDPDFWIYLGDTIYSDSSLKPAPSTTLNEYRDDYLQSRSIAALPDLMASASTYAVWDDHEVQNDYSGQTVDPTRYANGRRAFFEYMPTLEINLPDDPSCAGDPRFRVVSWGQDVDLFIVDERSCRSASIAEGNACEVKVCLGGSNHLGVCTVNAECPDGGACVIPSGTDDLVPTLPSFVRLSFIAAGFPLTVNPPVGCLAAIFDSSRTMLGPVQKAALKDALQSSTAKFKFIVNEVPMQQFWALPYDRWEGYGAERNELLSFIRDHVTGDVIFLTTDMHANVINDVRIDLFSNPAPIAPEFVTGPIATNTFQAELISFATGLGLPPALVVGAFHQLLSISGASCRNLDVDSYGLIEVDAGAGTATISLKDENGVVVTDQLTPATACMSTIGGP